MKGILACVQYAVQTAKPNAGAIVVLSMLEGPDFQS